MKQFKMAVAAACAVLVLAAASSQSAEILGTNTTTGNVTLTNMTWEIALTNAVGNTPLLTTLYNFGPGSIEYQWGATNAPDFMPPGTSEAPTIMTFGPDTLPLGMFYWRCASNSVTAVGRVVRKFKRQ